MEDKQKQLIEEIDKRIEKANEQAKNAAEDAVKKVDESLKGEINNLLEKNEELTKRLEKSNEHSNSLDVELQKMKDGGYVRPEQRSKLKQVENGLKDSEDFQHYVKNGFKGSANINLKVVGDMTTGANLTGTVIGPTIVPGVVEDIERMNHVRSLLPVAQTNSNTVWYVEETGSEGGPTTVAEGATKPQLDFDLEQKAAPVKKIAAYMRLSEELLNDMPALSGFLTQRATQKLMIVEDAQLLFGNGTGANLTGLTDGAVDGVTGGLTTQTIEGAQTWDAIIQTFAILANDEYSPSGIVMNPTDFYAMLALKDTQGRYLAPGLVWDGQSASIFGVPIVVTTAMTSGNMLVGDFRLGAQIFQREGISVRFYDQDQDNAIKNLVTVVVEERLAFPIYRPDVFVYDAISDITTFLETT